MHGDRIDFGDPAQSDGASASFIFILTEERDFKSKHLKRIETTLKRIETMINSRSENESTVLEMMKGIQKNLVVPECARHALRQASSVASKTSLLPHQFSTKISHSAESVSEHAQTDALSFASSEGSDHHGLRYQLTDSCEQENDIVSRAKHNGQVILAMQHQIKNDVSNVDQGNSNKDDENTAGNDEASSDNDADMNTKSNQCGTGNEATTYEKSITEEDEKGAENRDITYDNDISNDHDKKRRQQEQSGTTNAEVAAEDGNACDEGGDFHSEHIDKNLQANIKSTEETSNSNQSKSFVGLASFKNNLPAESDNNISEYNVTNIKGASRDPQDTGSCQTSNKDIEDCYRIGVDADESEHELIDEEEQARRSDDDHDFDGEFHDENAVEQPSCVPATSPSENHWFDSNCAPGTNKNVQEATCITQPQANATAATCSSIVNDLNHTNETSDEIEKKVGNEIQVMDNIDQREINSVTDTSISSSAELSHAADHLTSQKEITHQDHQPHVTNLVQTQFSVEERPLHSSDPHVEKALDNVACKSPSALKARPPKRAFRDITNGEDDEGKSDEESPSKIARPNLYSQTSESSASTASSGIARGRFMAFMRKLANSPKPQF